MSSFNFDWQLPVLALPETPMAKAIKALSPAGILRKFMPAVQIQTLQHLLRGEEGEYFVNLVLSTVKTIEAMPRTYQTDGQADDAVVHLHYFMGSIDAWITEKDMGEQLPNGSHDDTQLQAYGRVSLDGTGIEDAEAGYVSIAELIENGVELDLHWSPKTFKELLREHATV